MESFDDASGGSSDNDSDSASEEEEEEQVSPRSAKVRNRMEAFDDASGPSDDDSDDDEDEYEYAAVEGAHAKQQYEQGSGSDDDSGSGSGSGSDSDSSNADSDDASDSDSDSDSEGKGEGEEGGSETVELINNKTRTTFRGDAAGAQLAQVGKELPLVERLQLQQQLADERAKHDAGEGKKGRKVLSARQIMKGKREQERVREGSLSAASPRTGTGDKKKSTKREEEGEEEERRERKRKNAPAVMASNKPVRRFRDNMVDHALHKKASVDPRFSDISGVMKEKHFYNNYAFLDDYQEDEIKKLEKAAKKSKGVDRTSHLKEELRARVQSLQERKSAKAVQARLDALWAEEKAKVANGKKAFFLKKSARKEVAMEVKFDELKQAGKLKSYMTKRRTKNSKKDHKWVPTAREN